MQDEMIVDLYWKRDESAISETERKYGRYLSKIAYNMVFVSDSYLKYAKPYALKTIVDGL